MQTAVEDIQHLIQIVKKDLEIQERKKVLDETPGKLKSIEKKLKQMDEDLHESKETLEDLSKERRHLEREVSDQNSKINQKKLEQIDVKTNKEFRALKNEIEYLSKLVDKSESRILVILDEMETKKQEFEAISEKVSSEKDVLLGQVQQLKEDVERCKEKLKILEDEKVRILPHISERVRKLYNRILAVKGDSGVANLVGDICQGCYSRIPPQKAHEIRKNNQILTCEVCGRIIVYYPVE
jgi:predicted  nucleic acid-binding Zn-ribbon protein